MDTRRLSEAWEGIPRVRFAFLPTPLTEAPRLSARLRGPRILLKRDDLTGLAFGGNKVRKLEYLLGEAVAQGCDTVVTGGAQQSNHSRQTAAAAAVCGLACHLALGGEAPQAAQGNLLIDLLCGAIPHFCGEHRKGEDLPSILADLESQGARPYLVPYGGSNGVGALGFVRAAEELVAQLEAKGERASHVVFASSSGGTHAGLALGLGLLAPSVQAVGIGIDKEEGPADVFRRKVVEVGAAAAELLRVENPLSQEAIHYTDAFHGEGYGVVGDSERRAIRLTAECEGVLLDPVYTGRAMGGLLQLVEQERLTDADTVVFWHSGGQPALFDRSLELIGSPARERHAP